MTEPVVSGGIRREGVTVAQYAEIFGVNLGNVRATAADGAHAHADVDNFVAARANGTPLVRKLAAQYNVDLRTVKGTGVGGRIRSHDVVALARTRVVAAAKPLNPAHAPREGKPKPVRDPNAPIMTTIDAVNAEINADPGLQRAFWELGVRDGIEKPPEHISGQPGWDPSWDPKPRLVMNDDGTGQWVTPPADFGIPRQTDRTDSD